VLPKAEISQPAVSYHGRLSTAGSDEPRSAVAGSASSTSSHSLVENVEPIRISLDDAWKSATTVTGILLLFLVEVCYWWFIQSFLGVHDVLFSLLNFQS
jgi:hypothetical protein